jgi:speckle-type POZ protein
MVTCKTSSTSSAAVYSGEHLFKVVGHSLITGNHAFVTSETFRVGGHDWAVRYYPNRDAAGVVGQSSSVFLQMVSACESEITVSFSCCLQDPVTPGTAGEKNRSNCAIKFSPSMSENQRIWGRTMFVSRAGLAASGCLKDDCLVIKCAVEFSKLISDDDAGQGEDDFPSIIVPPSNLTREISTLC